MTAHPNEQDCESPLDSISRSYARHRAELIIFFSRRSRDPAAGEDLVQLVYERLIRYRPRTPVRDPVGYLFETARRVLINANRRVCQDRGRLTHCDPKELDTHAQESRDLWVHEDGGLDFAQEQFERALAELPRNCRIALLRQRRDGWTYRQIADELGVSPNTVKDYMVKALEHFRNHFAAEYRDDLAEQNSPDTRP